jgi:hypothetical protein
METIFKEVIFMKFLRTLYMIIASIVLMPIIVLIEAIWLVFLTVICARAGKVSDGIRVWLKYIICGIDMNLDFIENGLK